MQKCGTCDFERLSPDSFDKNYKKIETTEKLETDLENWKNQLLVQILEIIMHS